MALFWLVLELFPYYVLCAFTNFLLPVVEVRKYQYGVASISIIFMTSFIKLILLVWEFKGTHTRAYFLSPSLSLSLSLSLSISQQYDLFLNLLQKGR
jgi:hypothetical protein